jgi:hypothetical protein
MSTQNPAVESPMPLPILKTVLASLAVLLALEEAWTMAEVRGFTKLLPRRPKVLARIHRWGGVAALVLILVIISIGLSAIFILDYRLYSPRLWAHASLGVLAALTLTAKVIASNRQRRWLRHSLALGIAAGTLVLGAFLFGAVWYWVLGA